MNERPACFDPLRKKKNPLSSVAVRGHPLKGPLSRETLLLGKER
jgi:hypothetical protein